MSKHQNPHPSTLPTISQASRLFDTLLPSGRKNGTPINPRLFLEALKEAKALQTDSRNLSPEEKIRFDINREILNRCRDDRELRQYSLLEVFETKQWRQNYQSFEEYAFIEGGIKKSQARKRLDSARIAIDFTEAGLENIAPKGRQTEELAKVARAHWIEAWNHVLKVFEIDGSSTEIVKSSLRDYCRDRNLQFGRRKPNGSKNIGLPSLMIARVPSRIRDARTIEKGGDWVDSLSTGEQDVFKVLPIANDGSTSELSESAEISIHTNIERLMAIASTDHDNSGAEKMRAVLALIQNKDFDLANKLATTALALLYEEFVRCSNDATSTKSS